jgi:uncharacterized protein YjlB
MKDLYFESALRRDGFAVDRRVLPPGTVFGEDADAFDVRALVMNGEITLTFDGQEHAYREGDIFIMPAGRAHAGRVGAAGLDCVVGRRRAKDADAEPGDEPSDAGAPRASHDQARNA